MTGILPDIEVCVVTDRGMAGPGLLEKVVRESLEAGAGAIQLREKELPARQFLDEALRLREIVGEFAGRLLIINDRVDIALACRADGVHLGQEDLPAGFARELMGPGAIIGVSVSSPAEAEQARRQGASYLGAGAVYGTSTKTDAGVIGLEGLKAVASAVDIPVMGIGGINRHNAGDAVRAGARSVAVVSEVMASSTPRRAVAALVESVRKARAE